MTEPGALNTDLQIALHAIVLIALPLGTIALLFAVRRRAPQDIEALIATVIAGVLVLAARTFKHNCNSGQPYTQWAIPGLCLWVILLFVADRTFRSGCAAVMTFAMAALCWHFMGLMHEPGWTGDPQGMRAMEQNRPKVMIREAEEFLAGKAASDPIDYEPCWLSELPPIRVAEISYELYLGKCPGLGMFESCWHSKITGLYRAEVGRGRDLWYLGGPIKDAKGRIVVRER